MVCFVPDRLTPSVPEANVSITATTITLVSTTALVAWYRDSLPRIIRPSVPMKTSRRGTPLRDTVAFRCRHALAGKSSNISSLKLTRVPARNPSLKRSTDATSPDGPSSSPSSSPSCSLREPGTGYGGTGMASLDGSGSAMTVGASSTRGVRGSSTL